jgi:hypothetical protein
MRVPREQFLLMCLAQTMPEGVVGYRSPERAYKELKHLTGQDFGYDIAAWKEWFKNTKDPFPNLKKPME